MTADEVKQISVGDLIYNRDFHYYFLIIEASKSYGILALTWRKHDIYVCHEKLPLLFFETLKRDMVKIK